MPSEHTTTSATERMKKFLEDKDWKFYCAVAAGVAAAGAGAYYLSTSGSDKKKPKQQKREMKKESTGGGNAIELQLATWISNWQAPCLLFIPASPATETKKEKEPATATVSEEQYETMSDEAIEALSQEVGVCTKCDILKDKLTWSH